MAIFTKQIFDNPYVDIGKQSDVCILCRKEYVHEHTDEPEYKAEEVLQGQLLDQRVFKLFRNSNVPFVLCGKHLHEIADMLDEES